MHVLIVIGAGLGLALACAAIFATASLGLIVWLAGTDWARRQRLGPPLPPVGSAKRLARGT